MFAIVGMLVVLAAVLGGFLMEHGPLRVLMQPAELLIIAGAALGILLVGNPMHTLKDIAGGVVATFVSVCSGRTICSSRASVRMNQRNTTRAVRETLASRDQGSSHTSAMPSTIPGSAASTAMKAIRFSYSGRKRR